MTFFKKFALGASVATLAALAPIAAVHAQQVTADLAGSVSSADGAPIAGATITVVNTRNNAVRSVVSGEAGLFSARGLTSGGPYTVTVTAPGFQGQSLEGVFLNLSDITDLDFTLDSVAAAGTTDVITVTGARVQVAQRAIGPGISFDAETLESFPSIQRDIRDIIRFDLRVSIDNQNAVDRVSCLGGNDRSNTFTVDGVVQADVFGLNGTPFAARNSLVLPFDAVAETVVEFAPFDVEFGQFTGCNISVITRSGTNAFSGSAFFVYNDDSLTGSSLEGNDINFLPFEDQNWGATLSGPIIKDKLFFFVAYEETDDADPQESGPFDGGFANGQDFLSTAQALEISDVLSEQFGIETGGIANLLPETNRRFLVRGDWLINDRHRFEFTYQRLNESNVESDDFSFSDRFIFAGTFEEEGTESQTFSARLFSQWTDNLSTEVRASRAIIDDIQGPVGGGEAQSGNPIPRIIVGVENNGDIGSVLAGPGQFRSANQLNSRVDQYKLKADYTWNRHTFTAGYEANRLDIFNLFIVNATSTLVFQDVDALRAGQVLGGGIFSTTPDPENIAAGTAAGVIGVSTASGDPNQAAAEFSRTIHTLYIQDEWQASDRLTLQAGLRYDIYGGSDAPPANPNFIARYGFSNAVNFTQLDAVLPRLGFTYESPIAPFGETTIRGGAGIFTGGDPTVWFSNAFSNSGFNAGSQTNVQAGCTEADLVVVDDSGRFTGVPACALDAAAEQAALGLSDTQSTDPDLELATVIRSNIGTSTLTDFGGFARGFFDDWRVDLDVIHSQFRNPFSFVDLSQTVNPALGLNGFAADGRPIFRAIDPTVAGCDAVLLNRGGTPPTFTGVTADCFATGRDDEIQLTNSEGFSALTFSAIFDKRFEYTAPFINLPGSARVNFGYAFTDSNNHRDLTSAQSTSNFDGSALFNRQDPGVATSGFETRHNVRFTMNLEQEFVRDYPTSFGLSFGAQSGRPFSFTFDGSGDFNNSASGSDNALLYVPSGVDDPVLSPSSDPAAVAALVDFINADACLSEQRGSVFERNSCRNDWFLDFNVRFAQELPGALPGHRTTFFIDIDNFANLISDEANIFRDVNQNVDLVDVAVDDQGRLVITDFNPDFGEEINLDRSLWRVQLGVRYAF